MKAGSFTCKRLPFLDNTTNYILVDTREVREVIYFTNGKPLIAFPL